jgi:hypothetical protein
MEKNKPVTRVQLDLPDEWITVLDELESKIGVQTRKEVIVQALHLFDEVVYQCENGRTVGIIDTARGGFHELLIPVLRSVKRRSKNGDHYGKKLETDRHQTNPSAIRSNGAEEAKTHNYRPNLIKGNKP